MKNILLKFMAFVLVISMISSCQKEVNQWPVDPSHDRLFKTLSLTAPVIEATAVTLSYNKSVGANKYIFEFSKDSLEFKEIVKTVEILADTLTEFAHSPTPTRVQYRTVFDDLDGTTQYSVRMKCVDTVTGSESKYTQLAFHTPNEQLFTAWEVSTTSIKMIWVPTDKVTELGVVDPTTMVVTKKIPITDAEKAAGEATITGLSSGTSYQIIILNEDNIRGSKTLKTSGLPGAYVISVNPGDDISALLTDAVAGGNKVITLLFAGGQTYEVGSLVLPAALTDISFTGEKEVYGEGVTPAVLNAKEVRLGGTTIGKVIFEKVVLNGGTGDYLINMATDNVTIGEYTFENTVIKNYRSPLRIQNKIAKIGMLKISNSIVEKTGDYGVVNVGGASVSVDSLKITNNTFINIATQLMDIRNKMEKIAVNNNIFYNSTTALTQLIRLDKNNLPNTFEGANNIIAGTNNGAPYNAFSLDYAGSFAGSYRTNEMTIQTRDFPEITVFPGSATDLFADPENGDFHVDITAGFGGYGAAGDPRWFQ